MTKKPTKDSAEKIVQTIVNMSGTLTAGCHFCDYWKGHIKHSEYCLLVRARRLLKEKKHAKDKV